MSDASHLQLPASPHNKSRHADSLSSLNAGLAAGSKGTSPVLGPDRLRSASASPLHFHRGRISSPIPGNLLSTTSHGVSSRGFSGARKALAGFWTRNRGVLLVALSQFFGALMNLTARLLELEGNGMHPFQVLFARQGLTTICCVVYMWWTKVPDFPLGKKEVRWLLVVRGVSGFFGIYCLWYSMMYLPLAEATVISFLAPSVAGYICHVVLHEPFTKVEQLASVIALGGVVLIAHPQSLFSGNAATEETPAGTVTNGTSTALPGLDHVATVSERLFAIGSALIGVLGAAGAFTTIRWIGKRAHPLISVNYFAAWCTIVCTVVLIGAPMLEIGQPAIRFGLPASIRQWVMLFLLGIFGFVMQFMMTAGLGSDRSNRANAMIYTHMLFAAGFDRWIFGHHMGLMSLAGCGLIIGSMLWAVLSRSEAKKSDGDVETGNARDVEEMQMMIVAQEDSDSDSDADGDSFRHLP